MKDIVTCIRCGFSFFKVGRSARCPGCGMFMERDSDGCWYVIDWHKVRVNSTGKRVR